MFSMIYAPKCIDSALFWTQLIIVSYQTRGVPVTPLSANGRTVRRSALSTDPFGSG